MQMPAAACAGRPSVRRRSRRGSVRPGRSRDGAAPTGRLAGGCVLRRSTMLRNAVSAGMRSQRSAHLISRASVRSDSTVGIVGTTIRSDVANTAFNQQRKARRAIEEYHVVVATKRTEQVGHDALRLCRSHRAGDPASDTRSPPAAGRGRRSRCPLIAVASACPLSRLFRPKPATLGLYAEGEAGRALRIEIPEQRAPAGGRGEIRQIDGGRGLSDAAFQVVDGDDAHLTFSPSPRRLNARRQAARMSCAQNRASSSATWSRSRSPR